MEQKNQKSEGRIAVIRVRGSIKVDKKINRILDILRLYKNNFCTVVPGNEKYMGMIKKVKDYVTWGEISDDVFDELVDKRGEEFKGREEDKKSKIKYNKYIKIGEKKYKKFFRLNMPKKGFGRKGVKVSFSTGGALGYRGDKINDLIKRMM